MEWLQIEVTDEQLNEFPEVLTTINPVEADNSSQVKVDSDPVSPAYPGVPERPVNPVNSKGSASKPHPASKPSVQHREPRSSRHRNHPRNSFHNSYNTAQLVRFRRTSHPLRVHTGPEFNRHRNHSHISTPHKSQPRRLRASHLTNTYRARFVHKRISKPHRPRKTQLETPPVSLATSRKRIKTQQIATRSPRTSTKSLLSCNPRATADILENITEIRKKLALL
jgi:hypothetical protein